ncbi:MAG: hypothetical protein A2487_02650 [Candidatus Raymondbacteria bacterium RifOxyC12_full_50_8]|uniref:DUF6933 domain-containing protein n=1 Tax=Candidatus Raymondbacteria bacterium RIFOXYD12_FULL_49_13 TaxID=1817890 RepID=A0A1F7F9M9_UNCRA|nr:MAG: hypothetical protein A2350_06740 [Candidatus Raymondbacteria bacterium RifOxyB12_full_50_8]OGJ93228.1 MAG: hypothetical protein A2248_17820 [Candidatus Raymondbacteria bacterium RIFOXYA2_FULL_49_16]OGJ94750.1 MAG: hypothetical protein A2487_02650 [Candidatus Raymondbacteria bacterium RifOxyC12_full_50_8]OGK03311.1 MAG: hypothetical protein A2519_15165 [Candidatus Raymondbacteria bacterium RIFOXYD12_FULL_49_13]OGP44950.1 MAG: hypothetical protein A2324_19745 [Candidatus Raymondbacteria b
MIIRFSQKLADKIKEPGLSPAPMAENPFLDWHAHLFIHQRAQYILVTNSQSLFSVFFFGKGVSDFNWFYKRMSETLGEVLHDMGADLIYQRAIIPNTGQIHLAKSQDKKVISSMNELVFAAKDWLDDGDVSPYDLAFKVNEMVLS